MAGVAARSDGPSWCGGVSIRHSRQQRPADGE
jgi:hypothetical protein